MQPATSHRATVLLPVFLLLLSGCTSKRIEESRLMATGLGEDEVLVILGRTTHSEHETEESFVDCMVKSLGEGANPLPVMGQDEFRDLLYPWFEPRTAPESVEGLAELVAQPGVSDQILAARVRYLAWIDGSTRTSDSGGSLSCAVSSVGGGCFGITYWEEDASYQASVWDVKNLSTAGEISADATGTSYVAGLLLPIPFLARSGNAACKALSGQLREFILDES